MGLLDDAIREHLELKRQHGADPGEVAREERAALAPLRDDEDSGSSEASLDPDAAAISGDGPPGDLDDRPVGDSSNPLQETAEIDMRTVLEGLDSGEEYSWSEMDREARAEGSTPAPARSANSSDSEGDAEEDSLEGESPVKRVGRLGRLMGRRRGSGGESAGGKLPD
jgi:hypothetical protein